MCGLARRLWMQADTQVRDYRSIHAFFFAWGWLNVARLCSIISWKGQCQIDWVQSLL